MQFISSHSMQARFQPEDDIDKLFNRLSQLEPPDELISHILSRVQHLPTPLSRQMHSVVPGSEELDSLVVRNERRDPS